MFLAFPAASRLPGWLPSFQNDAPQFILVLSQVFLLKHHSDGRFCHQGPSDFDMSMGRPWYRARGRNLLWFHWAELFQNSPIANMACV